MDWKWLENYMGLKSIRKVFSLKLVSKRVEILGAEKEIGLENMDLTEIFQLLDAIWWQNFQSSHWLSICNIEAVCAVAFGHLFSLLSDKLPTKATKASNRALWRGTKLWNFCLLYVNLKFFDFLWSKSTLF